MKIYLSTFIFTFSIFMFGFLVCVFLPNHDVGNWNYLLATPVMVIVVIISMKYKVISSKEMERNKSGL